MRAACGALAGLLLGATGVAAQDADLRAAGRVFFADGTGGCSGALIAADLVLTAAHCVPTRRDGAPLVPGDLVFAPTGPTGVPGAAVPAMAVAHHPLWDQLPAATRGRIRFDLALMRLVRPVPARAAAPLPMGVDVAVDVAVDLPPGGAAARGGRDRVFVVSFRSGGAPRQRQSACPVLLREGGTLTLGCEVRSGESGSPVLATGADGRLAIVGVTVARSDLGSRPVGIAVDLTRADGPRDDLLAELVIALDAAQATARDAAAATAPAKVPVAAPVAAPVGGGAPTSGPHRAGP